MADGNLAFGERKFKQTYTVRVALGTVVVAILYLIWITTETSSQPGLIWLCATVVFVYGAVCIAISSIVLTISDHGIRRESLFGVRQIPWEEIRETRYSARQLRRSRARLGLAGLILAVIRRASRIKLHLTVLANDGTQIKITSNYRQARVAIGTVLGRVLPPMVEAVRSRVCRGETVFFGELALSPDKVTWKRRAPVALAEITSAEIVGRNLQLKCSGKWLTALKVKSDKIPNVLVFLEVLESIVPQLGPTRIDPLARVRL